MANIIKFLPRGARAPEAMPVKPDEPEVSAQASPESNANGNSFFAGLVKTVWVVTVLVWPLLKWLVSFDVVFQLVRMIYHWNTPGSYAGFRFLLHFAVLTALVYFVSLYKPKGI